MRDVFVIMRAAFRRGHVDLKRDDVFCLVGKRRPVSIGTLSEMDATRRAIDSELPALHGETGQRAEGHPLSSRCRGM